MGSSSSPVLPPAGFDPQNGRLKASHPSCSPTPDLAEAGDGPTEGLREVGHCTPADHPGSMVTVTCAVAM